MIYSIPIDYASISSTSSADGAVLINYPFEFNKSYEHKNILGSCNGLVCLKIESFDRAENERGELSHTWYYTILNPLTGEYKDFLGPPSHGSKPRYSDCKITYGFGYDSNLDDYKLAIVSDFEKAGCFKIDIYTVKLNSWSHTQGPLNYSFRCGGERSRFRNLGNKASYGVFLNGSLHWLGFSGSITTQGTSSEVIIYFDISNGTVVNMPLPENLMASLDLVGRRHMNMGVWGDCICIAARTCVWVMQEYGVEESWMRRYTRTQLIAIGEMQGELIGPFVPYNQPLWCFHNGEILINNCRENLRLYDPTNETVRSVVVCDITMDEDRESYVESLVSLGSGTYMEKQIPHGQRLR
ncbi:F-box/kelch-repeat protein At3g23880-like [Papaver somniferum]|uniref:F-box/kelch-repeat protein At3g23880-like n=1 Tax=Papaver somniferum TaxID=3469 RepID=UPI000E702176|nr:F-box/kelch-repeat protein At3g23880-like [Papaver somniferum]